MNKEKNHLNPPEFSKLAKIIVLILALMGSRAIPAGTAIAQDSQQNLTDASTTQPDAGVAESDLSFKVFMPTVHNGTHKPKPTQVEGVGIGAFVNCFVPALCQIIQYEIDPDSCEMLVVDQNKSTVLGTPFDANVFNGSPHPEGSKITVIDNKVAIYLSTPWWLEWGNTHYSEFYLVGTCE